MTEEEIKALLIARGAVYNENVYRYKGYSLVSNYEIYVKSKDLEVLLEDILYLMKRIDTRWRAE